MIIARFGDTWAGAYQFSTLHAEDNWESTRKPLLTEVGGASGAFDFFGEYNYPIQPVTIKKKFWLQGSSYSNVASQIEELRRETIAAGRSKIWGQTRDGDEYWAYAKCTGLKASEKYGQEYTYKEVELSFIAPEGIWYGEEDSVTWDLDAGETSVGYGIPPWIDEGLNIVTPVKVTVTNSGSYTDWIRVFNQTATPSIKIQYNGRLSAGDSLIIDASIYTITNDGDDAYDDVTIPDGQVIWIGLLGGLSSGNNIIVCERDRSFDTTTILVEWTPMLLM